MAIPNPELIFALRKTVDKLKNGAAYEWGHMGSCNCGNLAQELIYMTKDEIHRHAMTRSGDWNDQLLEYCPSSGYPMDLMISKLLEKGLRIEDLRHLEKLSDPMILSQIPFERRIQMKKNFREDVILYLEKWTEIMENQWLENCERKKKKIQKKNNRNKVFA
ncbi:hypothetical protein [Mariniradius sediminis]|jgi:hypothetical protein|uniref:Uncharacterized protein n=1 Tax=Mariniradius sediminis TaxID=2909237 RepID=A0ABS9BZ88_9BACT|nr:hypothetical protein [Mariniradius sediminis]MCF1752526.1 hypothetical protein [Mariniradius sediminis]